MKGFKITVFNESDAVVYVDTITAKDENEAIIELLKKVSILNGDAIYIVKI